MGRDDVEAGAALLVAGYDPGHPGSDLRLPLITHLGEALLSSGQAWRIRRLAPGAAERDRPTRSQLRQDLAATLDHQAHARILVLAGELTRTVEGPALLCTAEPGAFPEDGSVPLDWIAGRLRKAAATPTALVIAARGAPADARAALDRFGAVAADHLIAVDLAGPSEALTCLLDGLWGQSIDLATGTVTPRSLAVYLAERRPGAAVSPAASARSLLAPRALARPQASERGRAPLVTDELVGSVLPGGYRVVEEVGRGASGVVYRGHHELTGRDVALKLLPAALGTDEVRRFAREVRALAGLDHRHVVRVFHADVMPDGRPFFAMELVAGPTLEELLARGPLAPHRALTLIRQLVSGLAAAHAAGVVHADIKPANAVVEDGREPRVVLLDFGLARLLAEPVDEGGGTPLFMAPEQLSGKASDPASDVFAAALLALTLAAGTTPRSADERHRALALFPDDGVRAALARSIAPDPAARFPSAVELARALGADVHDLAAPPPRPPFRLAAPFAEDDSADFFGRERDVDRLLEHVLFRRAVVYVAPSGTGKTSLLRAGLLPRLRALGVDGVYVACRAGVPVDLRDVLHPGAASPADALQQRVAARSPARVVVVIDQIEAALVDERDAGRGRSVLEDLELSALPADAAVSVVWSVREEYLARLLERAQRIEPGLPIVRLGPLDAAAAAEVLGTTLARRAIAVEPALIDALVADLTRAAEGLSVELGWGGGPAVYPPHLQLAGAVLDDARGGGSVDLALYQRLGGLGTILNEHLRQVLEGDLGTGDTAIARDVLLALVTSSHTRVACQQAELVARARRAAPDRSDAAVLGVLQFLRERGLVVAVSGPGGEPVWDLAHDSLVAQIEAWVTASDLARLRALELVRYRLRRSQGDAISHLEAGELREVDAQLRPADLALLDEEWRSRPDAGPDAATRLVTASRRLHRRRRTAVGGFALAALGVAGGLGLQWRSERSLRQEQVTLRDRDIGTTFLVLRAFDWDADALRATDVTGARFEWTLHRPSAEDSDLPGDPFAPGDLSSEALLLRPGAVTTDAIRARGGRAVLVVHRHDRSGARCTDSIVPLERLPGHGEFPHLLDLRIPTCDATLAGTIEIPAGPFYFGGVGEPPTTAFDAYPELQQPKITDLPAYRLDRTELPNALLTTMRAAFEASGNAMPHYPESRELAGRGAPTFPVANLNWHEARAVCRLLGKRLPSSAEWQKALRGGLTLDGSANPHPTRNLPWGVEVDLARANVRRGELSAPAPVGAHPRDRGPYGHLDLAGNLTEWTSSLDDAGFAYFRGGNWDETSSAVGLIGFNAIENPRSPRTTMYIYGFRCAM